MQATEPWYRQFDTWAAKANRYLSALVRLPLDAPQHNELRAYADFSNAQLIFESNLIEGAGLSKGETRKLIEEHFPQIPSSYQAFQKSQHRLIDYVNDAREQLQSLSDTILRIGSNLKAIEPSVLLGRKSRPINEVIQHALALQVSAGITMVFNGHLELYKIVSGNPSILNATKARRLTGKVNKKFEFMSEILMKISDERIRIVNTKIRFDLHPQLITEEKIRILHLMIAKGLLSEDAGVPAGEYRIDNRIVDWDFIFPAPELVPAAMQQYVAKAHEALTGALDGRIDRFLVAAQISYDLVRIHPFPDFNGRVSRLLLMMVLNACGVPFPVTLRGDSKSRRRYFRALKYANNGNLKPYAMLIAMRVVQAFEAVEQNLVIAGLPSILSFARPPEFPPSPPQS